MVLPILLIVLIMIIVYVIRQFKIKGKDENKKVILCLQAMIGLLLVIEFMFGVGILVIPALILIIVVGFLPL